jgi:hypothetical protein
MFGRIMCIFNKHKFVNENTEILDMKIDGKMTLTTIKKRVCYHCYKVNGDVESKIIQVSKKNMDLGWYHKLTSGKTFYYLEYIDDNGKTIDTHHCWK